MKGRTVTLSTPLASGNLVRQAPATFERKVVWDLHGVLVDWISPFCAFASKVLDRKIHPENINVYRPGYAPGSDLTPREFDQLFTQFARLSRGGYGDLKPLPGAVDAMKEIVAAGIESEIWTYTPGASDIDDNGIAFSSGVSQGTTKKLIEKLGLPVDVREVRWVYPSKKAGKMAQDGIPVIIEDNPTTAVQVATEYGHNAILIPQNYNQGVTCPGVIRVKNHSELASTVIQLFSELEDAGVLR